MKNMIKICWQVQILFGKTLNRKKRGGKMKISDCSDLLELIALAFFIHFIIFTFLEIVFITIFEKLKFKKIADFLGEFFLL